MGSQGQVYLQQCVVTSGLGQSRPTNRKSEGGTENQNIRLVQPLQLLRRGPQLQVHLVQQQPANEQPLDPTPMWSAILKKEAALIPQIGDSFSHLLPESSNATIMSVLITQPYLLKTYFPDQSFKTYFFLQDNPGASQGLNLPSGPRHW